MQLRVYNFYRLNDVRQASYVGPLTANQILGLDTVDFEINMTKLLLAKDVFNRIDYVIGGRVYLEAAVGSLLRYSGFDSIPTTSTFLDFYDAAPTDNQKNDGPAFLGLYVGLGSLLLV